jgi:hypothetical protein
MITLRTLLERFLFSQGQMSNIPDAPSPDKQESSPIFSKLDPGLTQPTSETVELSADARLNIAIAQRLIMLKLGLPR